MYKGTYKINGSTIKVKTEQNSGSYALDAMSMAEGRQDGEELLQLEYFQKLMEAAWLLFMEVYPEEW